MSLPPFSDAATSPPPITQPRSLLRRRSLGIAISGGALLALWIWARTTLIAPGRPVAGAEAVTFLVVITTVLYPALRWLIRPLLDESARWGGSDMSGIARLRSSEPDRPSQRGRELSQQSLYEREQQFHELVRVLPDGVLILAEQRVVYTSAAAAVQFGFEAESILGAQLQALVSEVDHPKLVARLLDAADASPAASIALVMRRRDGSQFRAGLSVGCVRYEGQDCRLLVVHDLSEPERMRDALAESNAELQAMARRLFSLQEDERRAISRDLHDDIGQAITAMKLSVHAAIDEADQTRRREDLMGVVALADSSVIKLRNLSMLLRPPQLDALGLEAALRWQAGMLFRSSSVGLHLDIAPLPFRPSDEVAQVCFRIAQESLTNALRHASAGEISLTLRPRCDYLTLQIADDGDGFDPDSPRGLGLIMMRERAQTVGGTLRIDSEPGVGTQVSLLLPYLRAG